MALNVTIKELEKEEIAGNRAVIYARYSSNKQKDASIEQQVEACMDYIKSKKYTLVKIYSDSAKSASHDTKNAENF